MYRNVDPRLWGVDQLARKLTALLVTRIQLQVWLNDLSCSIVVHYYACMCAHVVADFLLQLFVVMLLLLLMMM